MTGACEFFLDDWTCMIPDPFGETGTDCPCPAFLLTARGRKRIVAGASNEVRREGADVVGDVDIFRETTD